MPFNVVSIGHIIFISGLTIKQKGIIHEGDFIQVKNIKGLVETIDLIETKIKTKEGDLIFIPNAILTKHEIINYKIAKNKSSKSKK